MSKKNSVTTFMGDFPQATMVSLAAGNSFTNAMGGVNFAPSFIVGDGKVITNFLGGIFPSDDWGTAVTVQTDGKILVAGTIDNVNFGLARYNSDGSLDTGFGSDGDGMVITDFSFNSDRASSIRLQADGKILVAGTSFGSHENFALVRYNSDGSLDTSFDGDGKVVTDFGFGSNDVGQSVTVQADGKILVAGYSTARSGSYYEFALARYNSNGALDTSFDGDGKVFTHFGSGADLGESVIVQPDGKILVAGSWNNAAIGKSWEFSLARYNSNGSLDTSFDGDGLVSTDIGSFPDLGESVTLQADGKILVAGASKNASNQYDFALVRYNNNGSLDTSFDGDGKVITDFGFSEDDGMSVTLQTDGKILVVGYSGYDFALVRYNNNGSLDISFDGDGKVITDLNTSADIAYSVSVQNDGKILVAGSSSFDGGANDFALVRYNADGSLDKTFNAVNSLDGVISYTENGEASVLDDSVQIYDAELVAQGNYNGASITLARHGGANNQDVFSGSGQLSFSGGDAVYSGVTIGTVSNSNGILNITFNSDATQDYVNGVLSSLAYSNSSDAPDPSVQIDWTFDDGNLGTQGAGGALSALGSTAISIQQLNDAPKGAVFINGFATQGQTLTATNTLKDADGLGAISYTWKSDTTVLGTGNTYTVKATDIGKSLMVVASYIDQGGTQESKTSTAVLAGGVNSAPRFSGGNGGIVTNDFGSGNSQGKAVKLQADGKILVAGYTYSDDTNWDFALIRYNSDGSLDTSFDGDGKVTTDFGATTDIGISVTVQADGKILMAGYDQFMLVRYNSDGSLDTTFDGDGKVKTDFGFFAYASSVTVQANGKILVAGASNNSVEFALARYNSNGTLDTTFGGDGIVTTRFGSDTSGEAVIVQADGKILVAGVSDTDIALARYNSNGSLDTSFDSDGIVTTDFGSFDSARSVALQVDGKILVVGSSGSSVGDGDNIVLARYNRNGSLDSSFDGDGKVSTYVGSNSNYEGGGYSVTVQADGKILVAGFANFSGISGDSDFILVRYHSNGSLDTSFDGDGIVTTDLSGIDRGYSISLQADGKILVAGTSNYFSPDSEFALVRYNADGSLDSTFNNGLNYRVGYTENDVAIVLDNAVNIYDTELAAKGNYSGASLSLARHNGANNEDVFSGSGSLSFSGTKALLSGVNIGTFSHVNGILKITFNANATQDRVNTALSSLAYSNSSDAPNPSVQIDWTFNDGNTGRQGTGGALSALGTTLVNITQLNDAPTGSVFINGAATQGQTLTATNTLVDPDGLGEITYTWKSGATVIGIGNTYKLKGGDANKTLTVTASYTDLGGAQESVTSETTDVIGVLKIGTVNADTLIGTVGNDIFKGLGGNDTYVVGNIGDKVVELLNEGIDTVKASVTYSLSAYLENLTLTGNGAINGTGNSYANILTGNAANNLLSGLVGNDNIDAKSGVDALLGGTGNDLLKLKDFNGDVVDGGTGTDTLQIYGTNQTIDLSKDNVKNIEIIKLADNGNNTLILNSNSVLDLSSDSDTLKIDANGDNTVRMENDWIDNGIISGYRNFTKNGATLLVDADISNIIKETTAYRIADEATATQVSGIFDSGAQEVTIDFDGEDYSAWGLNKIDLTGFGLEDKLIVAKHDGHLDEKAEYGNSYSSYIVEKKGSSEFHFTDRVSWQSGSKTAYLVSSRLTHHFTPSGAITYVSSSYAIQIIGLPTNLPDSQFVFI